MGQLLPPPELQVEVDRVWRVARRRYVIYLAVFLGVIVVGELVFFAVMPDHHHQPVQHHHRSPAGIVIVVLVSAVFAAGYVWWIRRLFRSNRGSWVPLTFGIPRSQRRQLAREVRAGTPPADPLLQYLGARSARKLALQRNLLRWITPVSVVFLIIAGVSRWQQNRLVAVLAMLLAAFQLAATPRTLQTFRGADAYLRAVGLEPDQLRKAR